ncbi:MarR family transcriptional regulator [Halopenitus persicus]|uniref:MarR family transcriptional regulator n=1 Tax=Halopenitus persicus TaxID=1048396 RepID=UPI000BBB5D44|nr:helix-turn-helix domain-containing protein [Halopenitus persicus]
MSAPEAVHADNADTDDIADRWDPVRDLPPSAKLVAKVLDYNDTLTQSQLAEETLLPPRTVRYALSRLEEEDVVDSRFSFADARKRLYSLSL